MQKRRNSSVLAMELSLLHEAIFMILIRFMWSLNNNVQFSSFIYNVYLQQ